MVQIALPSGGPAPEVSRPTEHDTEMLISECLGKNSLCNKCGLQYRKRLKKEAVIMEQHKTDSVRFQMSIERICNPSGNTDTKKTLY